MTVVTYLAQVSPRVALKQARMHGDIEHIHAVRRLPSAARQEEQLQVRGRFDPAPTAAPATAAATATADGGYPRHLRAGADIHKHTAVLAAREEHKLRCHLANQDLAVLP